MSQYEPGNYVAAIVSQGIAKSKKKGTPYLRFMLKPLAIRKGGVETPVDFNGERELPFWLTDRSADFAIEALIKLGYPFDTFDQFSPEHPKHHSFVGQQIDVYMELEPFTGDDGNERTSEKWNLSRDQKAAPLAKNEVSALNRFAGSFKAKRAELMVPASTPKRQPMPANNATFEDSETL